ncbi:hypothetical protein M378DRAFT_159397, partial [Amanita muscaria Koide BX008]
MDRKEPILPPYQLKVRFRLPAQLRLRSVTLDKLSPPWRSYVTCKKPSGTLIVSEHCVS